MTDQPESCGMCWRGPGSNPACSDHHEDYVRRLEDDVSTLNASKVDGDLAMEFLYRLMSDEPYDACYVDLDHTSVVLDGRVEVPDSVLLLLRRVWSTVRGKSYEPD